MTLILPTLTEHQRSQFDQFEKCLTIANQTQNLTTITEPEAIRLRHFEDSLAALPLLKEMGEDKHLSLLDVGSGPGLPGLALAIALPQLHVTSLETTGKKVLFQTQVIETLLLDNATAIQARAEEIAHKPEMREQFDIVTARALAPLSTLVELALPFVKPGGHLIAWKGPHASQEIAEAANAFKTLGADEITLHPYTIPGLERVSTPPEQTTFHLIIVHKTSPTPERFPRSTKAMRKRAL